MTARSSIGIVLSQFQSRLTYALSSGFRLIYILFPQLSSRYLYTASYHIRKYRVRSFKRGRLTFLWRIVERLCCPKWPGHLINLNRHCATRICLTLKLLCGKFAKFGCTCCAFFSLGREYACLKLVFSSLMTFFAFAIVHSFHSCSTDFFCKDMIGCYFNYFRNLFVLFVQAILAHVVYFARLD